MEGCHHHLCVLQDSPPDQPRSVQDHTLATFGRCASQEGAVLFTAVLDPEFKAALEGRVPLEVQDVGVNLEQVATLRLVLERLTVATVHQQLLDLAKRFVAAGSSSRSMLAQDVLEDPFLPEAVDFIKPCEDHTVLLKQLRVLDVDSLEVLWVQVRHELDVPWSLQHLRKLLRPVLGTIVIAQVLTHLHLLLSLRHFAPSHRAVYCRRVVPVIMQLVGDFLPHHQHVAPVLLGSVVVQQLLQELQPLRIVVSPFVLVLVVTHW